jgi:hypothetical protein
MANQAASNGTVEHVSHSCLQASGQWHIIGGTLVARRNRTLSPAHRSASCSISMSANRRASGGMSATTAGFSPAYGQRASIVVQSARFDPPSCQRDFLPIGRCSGSGRFSTVSEVQTRGRSILTSLEGNPHNGRARITPDCEWCARAGERRRPRQPARNRFTPPFQALPTTSWCNPGSGRSDGTSAASETLARRDRSPSHGDRRACRVRQLASVQHCVRRSVPKAADRD